MCFSILAHTMSAAAPDTQATFLKSLLSNDIIYERLVETRNIVFDGQNNVIKIANHCLMPDDDEALSFDIKELSQLPHLVSISLSESNIHGDIMHLGKLRCLVELDLSHTSVRGDVAHFMELPELIRCALQETNVDGNLHTFHTYREAQALKICAIDL